MELLHVKAAQNHMATTFYFTVSCVRADRLRVETLLTDAHLIVEGLENELTEFRETSPIYQLNHSEVGEWIELSTSALQLIRLSEKIRIQTHDAFDWTAKSSDGTCASDRIELDYELSRAKKLTPGAHAGFGAIGKGFALDAVRLLLEREGLENYILNAGGSSIVFSGLSEPGVPWQWGWSWSKDSDGNSLGVELSHETGKPISLGISGLHEKGFHIVDGPTGGKAQSAQSALIATSSAAEADALSTALFVSGWDEGMKVLSEFVVQDTATAFIDPKGVPFWNGFFQKLWGAPALVAALLLFFQGTFGELVFAEDGAIDLSSLGGGESIFNPYLFERNPIWMILPAVSILWVLFHLKKLKRKRRIITKGNLK